MIIDSHSHLNDEAFKEDLKEVIKRANDNRVGYILIPGWDISSSIDSIKIAKEYNLLSAVGIHPENLDDLSIKDIEKIKELTKEKEVIAIGEVGLDYHYTKENKDKQIEFLKAQLELSYSLNLPVIIHVRDAMGDFLDIIRNFFKTHKIKEGFGIMHSFSGSVESMNKCIKYGFYISFSGPVTFKNALSIKECAKECPLDKLLTETDSPYLSPVPFRGQRNEPINVFYTLSEISNQKNMDVKKIEDIVYNNFVRLFNLKEV